MGLRMRDGGCGWMDVMYSYRIPVVWIWTMNHEVMINISQTRRLLYGNCPRHSSGVHVTKPASQKSHSTTVDVNILSLLLAFHHPYPSNEK